MLYNGAAITLNGGSLTLTGAAAGNLSLIHICIYAQELAAEKGIHPPAAALVASIMGRSFVYIL